MANDNNIIFNEKLKFSWGHILAAIALIAISYCTFVGMVYILKGQFILSAIITAVISLVTAAIFLTAQQLKATDRKFNKRIKWERAIVFASPFVFLVLMVPFSHSWTVHHRQGQILSYFNNIITSSSNMFKEYEIYSEIRKDNYQHLLVNRDSTAANSSIEINNKLEVLDLILLSSNYDTLKKSSQAWMEMSTDPTVSTWNVFILGNITGIQKAIHSWYDDLQMFSETKLSDEEDAKVFDSSSNLIRRIDSDVDSLTGQYTNILGFSPLTIVWLILGYLMLLLPYLLQSRHSKTIGTNWTLFGFKNKSKSSDNQTNTTSATTDNNPDVFNATQSVNSGSSNDNDFESFKM